MTLTLADDGEPLAARLDRLLSCFRSLRKRPDWKPYVCGGAYCVQTTRGKQGDHWHVHLHCLVEGSYLPADLLSRAWQEVTEDSYIVDVRAAPSRKRIADYIAGYVARPDAMTTWPPEIVREYADAMHGRRMVHTWGSWHNRTVDRTANDDAGPPPEPCVPLSRITHEASRGCPIATYTLSALRSCLRLVEHACNDYEPYAARPQGAPLRDEDRHAVALILRMYTQDYTATRTVDERWASLKAIADEAHRHTMKRRRQRRLKGDVTGQQQINA